MGGGKQKNAKKTGGNAADDGETQLTKLIIDTDPGIGKDACGEA